MLIRRGRGSDDGSGGAHVGNLALAKARFMQDAAGRFADLRGAARQVLLFAVEIDRAIHRLERRAFNRQDETILARLIVGNDIVERRNEPEHKSGSIEPPAQFGKIAREKNVIEDDDELARIFMARGFRGEARIVLEAGSSTARRSTGH
jgi:hypothetical protein